MSFPAFKAGGGAVGVGREKSHSGSRETWGPWTGPCLSLAQDPKALKNDHPAQDKKQKQTDNRGARWLPTTDIDTNTGPLWDDTGAQEGGGGRRVSPRSWSCQGPAP